MALAESEPAATAAVACAKAEPATSALPLRYQQPSAGLSTRLEDLQSQQAQEKVETPDAEPATAPADTDAAGDTDAEASVAGTDAAALGDDAALSSPREGPACPTTPDIGSPVTPGAADSPGEAPGPVDSSCGSCDAHAPDYAASERSAGSYALPEGRPMLRRASPSGSLCSEQSGVAASRATLPAAGAAGGAGAGGQQLSARRQIREEMGEETEGELRMAGCREPPRCAFLPAVGGGCWQGGQRCVRGPGNARGQAGVRLHQCGPAAGCWQQAHTQRGSASALRPGA